MDPAQSAALAAWTATTLGQRLEALRALPGGRSNPTFRVELSGGAVVLRTRPQGADSRSHRIDREYRVLQALQSVGFPAPHPILYCADPAVLGEPFYLMSWVDGVVSDDADLRHLPEAHRAAAHVALSATLRQLHGVGVEALQTLGRGDGYLTRQLERWRRELEPVPGCAMARRLGAALAQVQWTDEPPVLVHGDYRAGNVLFDRSAVAAVLDWELATLGDPRLDVAHLLLPHFAAGRGRALPMLCSLEGDRHVPGWADLYAHSLARRPSPDAARWSAYVALAFLKLAAVSRAALMRSGGDEAEATRLAEELADAGRAALASGALDQEAGEAERRIGDFQSSSAA